ncbi:acyl-CoA dehydrogenase family protein [Catenuloplanes sp. NPDC051500]|uniref:acyl-CoA dehydrogenase family protein n=1 Tax=Catenuloplanes sp. NPDC051500 TaxID=3363959 RepID=UPI0037BD808A
MTDASLAAVRDTGALALATPIRHGGREADLSTRVQVLAALGQGCPSTAWITATTAEAKIAVRAALSDKAEAEVFADPDAVMCASARPGRAEAVAGGLRISGRWGYASGCEHATHSLLVALIDGTTPVAALVPATDLTVDRDWHVAGLSGSGSHTLVGNDVLVPDSHVLDITRMTTGGNPDIAIAAGLFATLLGATRGALDVVAAAIGNRPSPSAAYPDLPHVPGAQQSFAEATHRIDTAEQRLMRVAAAVDAVPPGESLTPLDRSRLRMDLLSATRECRHALDDLLDLHGSSGFSATNPLQRFWRDVSIGSRHVQFASHAVTQDYGTLLLGLDPRTP